MAQDVTREARERLRGLLAQATLTHPIAEGQAGGANVVHFDGDDITAVAHVWNPLRRSLIVAAVNALPALLDACEAAEAYQDAIRDAIQPQRPEDPVAPLGRDVREAATVVAVLDGLRARVADLTRQLDATHEDAAMNQSGMEMRLEQAEQRTRDAYRRGQEAMRERAVAEARRIADARAGSAWSWCAIAYADAIAALPITDAEGSDDASA